jgi:hypothetical protein
MIRSVYEYNHREWSMRYEEFKFSGRPIVDLSEHEAKAALAFMVQFNGDLNNKIHNLEYTA